MAGKHEVSLARYELPAEYDLGAVLAATAGAESTRIWSSYPDGGFRSDNLPESDYVVPVDAATSTAYAVMLTPSRIPSNVRVGEKEMSLVCQFDGCLSQTSVQAAGEEVSSFMATTILPAQPPLSGESLPERTAPVGPPRQAPPAPRAARPDSRPARGLFAVQVGAFQDRPGAERVAASLAPRYPACRVVRREGTTLPWKVLIGDLQTAKAAADLAAQARKEFAGSFAVRSEWPIQ